MEHICKKLKDRAVISFEKVCDYWQIVFDGCVVNIYSEIVADISGELVDLSVTDKCPDEIIGGVIVGIHECDDEINILFNDHKRIIIMPLNDDSCLPERTCMHFQDNTIIVIE